MIDAIIFEGDNAQSPVEMMLVEARHAALADNVEKLLAVPEIKRVFLLTNRPELVRFSDDNRFIGLLNTIKPAEFHFGRELINLAERFDIEAFLYLGGAAVPLIETDELSRTCRTVMEKNCFVTNNVQSADLLALSSASILKKHTPVATDNALTMMLRYEAGVEQVLMPVTLGTQFDIDTPTDLLVLADSPFGGPRLRAFLDKLALDTRQVRNLKDVLRGYYEDIALIGRVGAPVIARMNSNFRVRLRVFSEERGMKALGRLERGEVVSLLGYWIKEIGPQQFFDYLSRVARAAVFDTRVIFAHICGDLTDADRFYSDLLQPEHISHPWVREFTEAARSCPIPVVLGGHSLVAGGIYAWQEELGCLI